MTTSLEMARGRRSFPPSLWLGLFIAVMLDAPVQLLWKATMARYGETGGTGMAVSSQILWVLTQPRVWILLVCFAAQFFNWMWVLTQADLSFAQPFTALSYLTVGTGAAFFFHEHLSVWRVSGIALILCGVCLVGLTPHRTARPAAE